MLRLRKGAPAHVVVTLGNGAAIRVRPATQNDVELAEASTRKDLAGLLAGSAAAAVLGEVFGADLSVEALQDRRKMDAAARRLAEIYIVSECQDGWDGVVDDNGKPLPCNASNIALLLNDVVCNARIMEVVNARIHEEYAEKNVSSASPSGVAGDQAGVHAADSSTSPAQVGASLQEMETASPSVVLN